MSSCCFALFDSLLALAALLAWGSWRIYSRKISTGSEIFPCESCYACVRVSLVLWDYIHVYNYIMIIIQSCSFEVVWFYSGEKKHRSIFDDSSCTSHVSVQSNAPKAYVSRPQCPGVSWPLFRSNIFRDDTFSAVKSSTAISNCCWFWFLGLIKLLCGKSWT